jgi:hypothetical protein
MYNCTPLLLASRYGHLQIAEILLEFCASPNSVDAVSVLMHAPFECIVSGCMFAGWLELSACCLCIWAARYG